jgi:hypothetical protein
LIEAIEGRIDTNELSTDPIDREREAMMVMKEDWPQVLEQLHCSNEYYACWDCPAGRVVDCVILNCEKDIRDRYIGKKP